MDAFVRAAHGLLRIFAPLCQAQELSHVGGLSLQKPLDLGFHQVYVRIYGKKARPGAGRVFRNSHRESACFSASACRCTSSGITATPES